jgi:hypothetical protein
VAVSQTETTTDCNIYGNSAHCTGTSKERKQYYNDASESGCWQCYETPTEHANRIADWHADQRAKAAQRQHEAEGQREAHEAWLTTPEGQRQARLEYEAKQKQEEAAEELAYKTWMTAHSQYKQTEANNDLMRQYMTAHRLYLGKTKSYDKAFKDLSNRGRQTKRPGSL